MQSSQNFYQLPKSAKIIKISSTATPLVWFGIYSCNEERMNRGFPTRWDRYLDYVHFRKIVLEGEVTLEVVYEQLLTGAFSQLKWLRDQFRFQHGDNAIWENGIKPRFNMWRDIDYSRPPSKIKYANQLDFEESENEEDPDDVDMEIDSDSDSDIVIHRPPRRIVAVLETDSETDNEEEEVIRRPRRIVRKY